GLARSLAGGQHERARCVRAEDGVPGCRGRVAGRAHRPPNIATSLRKLTNGPVVLPLGRPRNCAVRVARAEKEGPSPNPHRKRHRRVTPGLLPSHTLRLSLARSERPGPKKERGMKKLLAVLVVFGSASAAFGYDNHDEVRWRGIAGVITAQNVDNPVGDPGHAHVDSGTFAWTARGGRARVNLSTGTMA